MKLYDIRERKYPDKRGDVFRSLQVFECWVCKALTNRVVMGGAMGYGVRAVCPNSVHCWHHELELKIAWLYEKPHPASYKKELQKEIDRMKKRCAKEIKNDLQGKPSMELKQGVTNVRSHKPGSGCTHSLWQ